MAEKETSLMEKNEVVNFNLWQNYWKFLTSLQSWYLNEIQEKLNRKDIVSYIECMGNIFDENGNWNGDHPELEEIYFQIPNHKTCIRISISCGRTQEAYLEFLKEDSSAQYYSMEVSPQTKFIFEPVMLAIACEWLDKGTLTEEGKRLKIGHQL